MDFFPPGIIKKKRDGQPLSEKEIRRFISSYVSGQIPDYQMSALLMAVFWRGMTVDEMITLVEAMKDSGSVLSLDDLPGFKIDKHSTGGVGDKISLVLAPLLACFDLIVPMISGRGLAHSGGTLDKLEAIPGLNTTISLSKFKSILQKVGFVIAGQTEELVPADRKIYALRDATATIESLPLIVASILCKKLAEDLDGLVLDVKTGKGAFFTEKSAAIELAANLIATGEKFGVRIKAVLSNMEQPLGVTIGNWLEVEEAVNCLRGEGPPDTMELVTDLAIKAFRIAGNRDDDERLNAGLQAALNSGKAFEKFLNYASLMGGDVSYLENPDKFQLPEPVLIKAAESGFIEEVDALEIGLAVMQAGGGRKTADDQIDPAAGVRLFHKSGSFVNKNDVLAEIYLQTSNKDQIIAKITGAFKIDPQPADEPVLILGEITREGKLIPVKI